MTNFDQNDKMTLKPQAIPILAIFYDSFDQWSKLKLQICDFNT